MGTCYACGWRHLRPGNFCGKCGAPRATDESGASAPQRFRDSRHPFVRYLVAIGLGLAIIFVYLGVYHGLTKPDSSALPYVTCNQRALLFKLVRAQRALGASRFEAEESVISAARVQGEDFTEGQRARIKELIDDVYNHPDHEEETDCTSADRANRY